MRCQYSRGRDDGTSERSLAGIVQTRGTERWSTRSRRWCRALDGGQTLFLESFVDITTRAMADKPQWEGLVYVDLFAGPGICVLKESGRRLPGSVLIAAHAPKPFRKIIACELDAQMASACEARLNAAGAGTRSHVLVGDCNERAAEIASLIPDRTLTLAFVDPTGLHAHFESIRTLTKGKQVDLLVLFADRIDIVRNVELYFRQTNSKLDLVLGPESDWRNRFAGVPRSVECICKFFVSNSGTK